MRKLLTVLKWLSITIAGIGAFIPGYSYWTGIYYPPLFKLAGILSALGGLAVIVIYYYQAPPDDTSGARLPLLIKRAIAAISLSVALLIGYFVLFNICTVADPTGQELYQIGFGKIYWSLTDEGKQVKAKHPNQTVQDWMTNDSLYRPGGPNVIWKTWTIVVSGISMVIFYLSAFILWCLGWALIAKQSALSNANSIAA